MNDGPDRPNRLRNASDPDGGVESLASQALSVLASKRASSASLLSERFLNELQAAAVSIEPGRRQAVIKAMLDARIRREDIADFYIPEVARRMGVAWCEDGMGFAEVTIGSARLQGLLREIGAAWFDDNRSDPQAPGLMIIVQADEAHTLGAMVLASQLRRMGASVRLVTGRSESDVLRAVAEGEFDAILISASQSERLASLRKFVDKVRKACTRATPIVVGGSVVTRDADVKTQAGADFATTDPREALRSCGLNIASPGARKRATSD